MKLRISLVILSLVLSLLIGISLSRRSGVNGRVTNDEQLLIGFSMDSLKEARWQRDRDLFTARAEARLCSGPAVPPGGCGPGAAAGRRDGHL